MQHDLFESAEKKNTNTNAGYKILSTFTNVSELNRETKVQVNKYTGTHVCIKTIKKSNKKNKIYFSLVFLRTNDSTRC